MNELTAVSHMPPTSPRFARRAVLYIALSVIALSALFSAVGCDGLSYDLDAIERPNWSDAGSNDVVDDTEGADTNGEVFEDNECDPDANVLGGGNGTEAEPFRLCTPDHLRAVSTFAEAGHAFELGDDIDMHGEAFDVVGPRSTSPFIGTFDGNGYEIRGLTVDEHSPPGAVGMFGYTDEATTRIEDVTLVDPDIDVRLTLDASGEPTPVGGLVGAHNAGEISNCIITGPEARLDVDDDSLASAPVGGLVGTNRAKIERVETDIDVSAHEEVGGLVGRNEFDIDEATVSGAVTGNHRVGGVVGDNTETGQIRYSTSRAEVQGETEIGGLVGLHRGTIAESSVTSGSITGEDETGGLVGTHESEASIVRSLTTGDVEVDGRNHVGGLIGEQRGGSVEDSYSLVDPAGRDMVAGLIGRMAGDARLVDSYAAGNPSADDGAEGGLVAQAGDSTAVAASYWDTRVSGLDSGPGEGMDTDDFGDEANYRNWDFDDIWTIEDVEGEDRAQLQWAAD